MFLIHIVHTFFYHMRAKCPTSYVFYVQDDTKKRELLKNPTKIEEIQEKKIIDRN